MLGEFRGVWIVAEPRHQFATRNNEQPVRLTGNSIEPNTSLAQDKACARDVRCQEAPKVALGHVGVRMCYALPFGASQRLLVRPIVGVSHRYRMPLLGRAKPLPQGRYGRSALRRRTSERRLGPLAQDCASAKSFCAARRTQQDQWSGL